MKIGTITALDKSSGVQIKLDGEENGTAKNYSYLDSYIPAVGDRVLIEEISGSYVVIGKIITDFSSSGISRSCSIADNAKTAQTAASANTATSANTAQTAASANVAKALKNQNSSGRNLYLREENSVFYIGYAGGSWHKITTS